MVGFVNYLFLLSLMMTVSGFFISAAYADEKPLIEWFISDSAPLTIAKGQYKNQGYGDEAYHRIRDKLTSYSHQRYIVTLGHAQNAIKHHEQVCAYDLLKTAKREKTMIFSKPIYPVLPLGAISLASHNITELVDNEGYFMLSKLADNEDFVLGLAANRSYGEALDSQLLMIKKGRNALSQTGNNLVTGLFSMMQLNRVDASLGYASEAQYLTLINANKTDNINKKISKVLYYPIKGQPALLSGYVACNRSEFGRQVIAMVNKLIDSNDITMISQTYEKWLPKNVIPLYQKLTAAKTFYN